MRPPCLLLQGLSTFNRLIVISGNLSTLNNVIAIWGSGIEKIEYNDSYLKMCGTPFPLLQGSRKLNSMKVIWIVIWGSVKFYLFIATGMEYDEKCNTRTCSYLRKLWFTMKIIDIITEFPLSVHLFLLISYQITLHYIFLYQKADKLGPHFTWRENISWGKTYHLSLHYYKIY